VKTKLACPQCAEGAGGIGGFFVETIRDDGLYTGQCPKGHKLLLATQTLRYEMLFEIALNAISDGYYREAVSSFAASVERFYEFAIRVLALRAGLAPGVFSGAWKKVAAQSERQVGAFVFMYAQAFGEVPLILDAKKPLDVSELRNAVVHKGKLPSCGEAIDFGRAAYGVIQAGVSGLRRLCVDEVNIALAEHVAGIAAKMGNRYPRSFQVTPTALNVIDDLSGGFKPFDQHLQARGIAPLL